MQYKLVSLSNFLFFFGMFEYIEDFSLFKWTILLTSYNYQKLKLSFVNVLNKRC